MPENTLDGAGDLRPSALTGAQDGQRIIGGEIAGRFVQAAFFEFFPAAARTGIVASDVAQGLAMRHSERIQRAQSGPDAARGFWFEAVPVRHFLNGIAE